MRVLFFAHLKDVTGCAATELDCGEVDAEGLWAALLRRYPGLQPYRATVRLACNARGSGPPTKWRSSRPFQEGESPGPCRSTCI